MAKRKSRNSGAVPSSPSMPERKSVETEEVENGFVVRISHEGKHGYTSKRFIASTRPESLRIASAGMSGLGMGKKGSGKKKTGRAKKFAIKKA